MDREIISKNKIGYISEFGHIFRTPVVSCCYLCLVPNKRLRHYLCRGVYHFTTLPQPIMIIILYGCHHLHIFAGIKTCILHSFEIYRRHHHWGWGDNIINGVLIEMHKCSINSPISIGGWDEANNKRMK